MTESAQLHASCVGIDGKGVLLLGESGSGKSDVALRLIDGGAVLVGDDQIILRKETTPHISISPHPNLLGMIEARGVGIVHLPYAEDVPLALAVQLVEHGAIERMPEPQFWGCLGLQVPLLSLHAFDDSICAKIRLWLRYGK